MNTALIPKQGWIYNGRSDVWILWQLGVPTVWVHYHPVERLPVSGESTTILVYQCRPEYRGKVLERTWLAS